MIEHIYDAAEVADILGVNKRLVYTLLERGTLKGFKVGNKWRVTESAIKAFITV